jgi:hypothetical protein
MVKYQWLHWYIVFFDSDSNFFLDLHYNTAEINSGLYSSPESKTTSTTYSGTLNWYHSNLPRLCHGMSSTSRLSNTSKTLTLTLPNFLSSISSQLKTYMFYLLHFCHNNHYFIISISISWSYFVPQV